ncbi:ATP-binding protein [Nostoc sp. 'Peltigera malacea cyanobiont' DB3992]|uniref:ATP-binding protein n=1 Tax=Nostoc sp. 'Peltigera malacea cyanobiont' DB3992 TaxID=1206980 RepID=UPI00211F3747|nr:hypothetical protein [Nostoc sp. 'Peltigera malacea cyanobiont' DB3992]
MLFDNYKNDWQWNIKEIERVGITDNVVDLTIGKITKLNERTQKILQLAACIGNQFNLEVLSLVNNKSQITTARELQPALEAGLILPLSNDYKIPVLWNQEEISKNTSEISDAFIPKIPNYIPYKFLHDKVQQAAYALITEEEKKAIHLQVGRLLLENIQRNELESNIFNIVNQLNEGYELIVEQSERDNLAKLNLQAGKKAKASTAYQPALRYLETGLGLLPPNNWDQQYKLTLEIHVEILEVLYLNTKFLQVEELSVNVMKKVNTILDRVKIYRVKILNYFANFQQNKAIETAIQALTELGINISKLPESGEIEKRINQQQRTIKLLFNEINIEDLANFTHMSDPYKLEAIPILQHILSSTIQLNFSLHIEIILTQIELCIKYGNPPEAACIYSAYGMHLCGTMKDIDSGYKFGKISLKLLENSNISKLQALVMHFYYGFIWHWKEFLRNIVAQESLLEGFQRGINTGNNEYASYNAMDYCLIKFFGGYDLKEVEQNYTNYNNPIKKMRQEYLFFIYIYAKK